MRRIEQLIILSPSTYTQVCHLGNNCSPASILSLQAGIAVVQNSFPVIWAGVLYRSVSFGQAYCVVLCRSGRHPVSFCVVRAGILYRSKSSGQASSVVLCCPGRHPVSL